MPTVLELQKYKEEVLLEKVIPILDHDRASCLILLKWLYAKGYTREGIDYEIVNALRSEVRAFNQGAGVGVV